MDPIANINEQRELAIYILSGEAAANNDGTAIDRLAELVISLDDWRRHGGFDPYGR